MNNSLLLSFDSGQTFRFKKEGSIWSGVAKNRIIVLDERDKDLEKRIKEDEFLYNYFDFPRDYGEIKLELETKLPQLKEPIHFAPNLRILRQDPFETIISFIISQNNNIPRIKKSIEYLCTHYGKSLGSGFYSFPEPEDFFKLTENDIKASGVGFRSSYILNFLHAVKTGEFDISKAKTMNTEQLLLYLTSLKGIGEKVSSCIALFAFGKMDVFPRDVWINKIMECIFPLDDENIFGPYKGIAQQFLFYYYRFGRFEIKEHTISEIVYAGSKILLNAPTNSINKPNEAIRESRELFEWVSKMSTSSFILKKDEIVSPSLYKKFSRAIGLRKTGIPYAYITGRKNFYKDDFFVNKNVLIPRPETEILVEFSIKIIKDKNKNSVLDMCCGSGCIGESIKKYSNQAQVTLCDISSDALKIARKNKNKLMIDVKIVKSDLFLNIRDKFDLIVANPPYVSYEEESVLSNEVKNEPPLALYSQGEVGECFTYKLIDQALSHLNDNGYILIEINENSANKIASYLKEKNFKNIEVIKDLSQKDRIIKAQI